MLSSDDIKVIIELTTQEIHRVGKAYAPSYFYRLVDMRNKLLAIPVAEELPAGFNDKEAIKKRGS